MSWFGITCGGEAKPAGKFSALAVRGRASKKIENSRMRFIDLSLNFTIFWGLSQGMLYFIYMTLLKPILGGIFVGAMLVGAGCMSASQPSPPLVTTTIPSTIASSTSVILDFSQKEYDAAVSSYKLVVLYFYASWCPTCNEEFPVMQQAFEELKNPNVIGFRIHFSDNQASDDEKKLAEKYGVAYQHTKVIVKEGKRVVKSPESWDEKRYLDEIGKLLK